ncbi:DHA1 family inner membrane transport protein [Microbacterium lacticum]|uniref:DHA1 family inner membrane transport protein n=1 Tax=Microbacterium lacticum TaxID=33885 RepID=A0A543KUE8_9MICO|nr:DHA1 family inner membrane transport protein [Microbacterium lacticum]
MHDRFASSAAGWYRQMFREGKRRMTTTVRPAPDAEVGQPSAALTRRKAALALFALSVGGFGIGLTEFVIAGLLTEVATDLGVTISQAGHLVGVYALAVVPGALLITPFLMRRPPKYALAVLLAFFVVGNLLSAWAPTYEVMLAGRIVAALAHGGYFGIGAVLAASLVPPSKRASAVAALFAGLTIANVLGVPAGALVGQQYGWRMVFWIISALGLIALAGLIALVPKTEPERDQLPVAQQFKALARPQVLASLLTTALVFGGMFGVFTYIEPLLREVTGYSATAIPWLLVIFGAGLFAGNILGGKAADRNADNAVLILSILLPIVILTLGAVASMPVPVAIGLFLLGLVGFATVPGLQARVMRHAHGAATLASATNIAAFNLGNTIGVSLAGAAIAAGYGLVSPTVVGAGLTVIGLAVIVVARIAARRQASSSARHINSAI